MRQQPPRPRTTLAALITHAISSWGTTTRLIALLAVCATLLLGGVHLLDLTISAGPIQITPR